MSLQNDVGGVSTELLEQYLGQRTVLVPLRHKVSAAFSAKVNGISIIGGTRSFRCIRNCRRRYSHLGTNIGLRFSAQTSLRHFKTIKGNS